MPPRPRRRTGFRGSPARRRLVWAQRTVTVNAAANNTWINIDLLQEYKAATGAEAVGITVMRSFVQVLQHTPASFDSWWIGLKVDELNQVTGAFQNNALAVNPHDDPYSDWMLVRKVINDTNTNVGGPTFGGSGSWQGVQYDIRSKRRMHQVQQAYILSLYQDTVGTPAKAYDVFARVLLALP